MIGLDKITISFVPFNGYTLSYGAYRKVYIGVRLREALIRFQRYCYLMDTVV